MCLRKFLGFLVAQWLLCENAGRQKSGYYFTLSTELDKQFESEKPVPNSSKLAVSFRFSLQYIFAKS
jgi:hypothetical protein